MINFNLKPAASVLACAAIVALSVTAPTQAQAQGSKPKKVTFAAVKSVIDKNCVFCHQGPRPRDGVNLSSYDDIIKGSPEGKIVKPGKLGDSKLVWALTGGHGTKKMPPRGPGLGKDDIALIEAWIKAGAKK